MLSSRTLLLSLGVAGLFLSLPNPCDALIMGGTDNQPRLTEGSQPGVAAVFNVPGRVAWWEGPPFGGGQYHAECRGDADTFNDVLQDFAKIEAVKKVLVIHDGSGASFWLNMNREPAKVEAARIDWVFVAWRIDSWERMRNFPPSLRATNPDPNQKEPVPQIDVYLGGQIDWDQVDVPEGIVIDDQRLSVHGFSATDGRVLKGVVSEVGTGKPLLATVEIQQRKPAVANSGRRSSQAEWVTVKTTTADTKGSWAITNTPAGSSRIVARAEGYVSRIVQYVSSTGEPEFSQHDSALAKQSHVSGRVIDKNGQPIAGAEVSIGDTSTDDEDRYSTLDIAKVQTDASGRFEFAGVPQGWARVFARKTGYCRRGLSPTEIVPSDGVEIMLELSGTVEVEVEFPNGKRPKGYIVDIEPEGGSKVGSWGGSGNINEKNIRTFKNVPPDTYTITSRPNPGSTRETTSPKTVVVKPGETTYVLIQAK